MRICMINILAQKQNPIKQTIKTGLFYLTRHARFLPFGGDSAVLASAQRGLRAINVPFVVNASTHHQSDVTWVIRGTKSLEQALRGKEEGSIKFLVAGPNIVVIPEHHKGILKNNLIDCILVPSAWNRDWWVSLEPQLAQKIYVWPAGVTVPATIKPRAQRNQWIVFLKRAPDELYQKVIRTLEQKHINYKTIRYGSYTPNEYRALLRESVAMIHLQDSESQGLALQEAWAHNVPTLVWEPGVMISPVTGQRWDADTAAPYLTDQAGMNFRTKESFATSLDTFINQLPRYTPRSYVEAELSDAASAHKFMEIIKKFGYTG